MKITINFFLIFRPIYEKMRTVTLYLSDQFSITFNIAFQEEL